MEVTDKFKELDLIDRVTEEQYTEVPDIVQEGRDQDHPHWKEMQKSKMAVWGGLINSCEKKRSKKQRRKGKIINIDAEKTLWQNSATIYH